MNVAGTVYIINSFVIDSLFCIFITQFFSHRIIIVKAISELI